MYDTAIEIEQALKDHIPWMSGSQALAQVSRVALRCKCDRIAFVPDQPCEDLRAMHMAFYSRLFRRYTHRCEVAHFSAGRRYLGFAKFYPVAGGTVGETAIAFPPEVDTHLACWAYLSAEVKSRAVSVWASPFMQQDGHCGVCAQAAMWMALRMLNRRLGKPHVSIPQITEIAAEIETSGPKMPSTGLYWSQLAHVGQKLGFSPLLYMKPSASRSPWYPDGMLYRYIESGIPVLIGLHKDPDWDHAIIAVGHSHEPVNAAELAPAPAGYYTPATFMRSFLVNDDNLGPYRRMPINKWEAYTDRAYPEDRTPYSLYENATFLLALLPEEVAFFAEDAELRAFTFVSTDPIRRLLVESEGHGAAEVLRALSDGKVVLRTFLIDKKAWRRERVGKLQTGVRLPASLQRIYRGIDLPDYVWVVEITTVNRYNDAEVTARRQILGEAIVDSTATRDSPAVLLLHLPGFVLQQVTRLSQQKVSYEVHDVDNDQPYLGCELSAERRM